MKQVSECKIIAEIGSVHDGSFGNAMKLIDLAADVGADIVKFQMHIADAETLESAPSPSYFRSEPRYQYFLRTAFNSDQWEQLRDKAHKCGLAFMVSPFSLEAVVQLDHLGVDVFKIPSGEVTNIPLLEIVATTKRPTILSSGMCSWRELDAAVSALKSGGALAVLQCSSKYPCPPQSVGINVMLEMRERYSCPVGLSDHTLGIAAGVMAVAHGAAYVEKHLTFSRKMYGSDAAHSLEPDQFSAYVTAIREASLIYNHPVDKNDIEQYQEMKNTFEKSIVYSADLPTGLILESYHISYKKPGTGVPASCYKEFIGKTLTVAVSKNSFLKLEHFTS